VHGDLGDSIMEQDTVAHTVMPRVAPTLELMGVAAFFIVIVGVLFGIGTAVLHPGRLDVALSAVALAFSGMAPFVVALVLIELFAIHWQWFPALGLGSSAPLDRLRHLLLPGLALAASQIAFVGRTTRAAMIDALDGEYIVTARSRGLTESRVVFKHALRHALVPVMTVSGLAVGYLISGAVLIEYAFGLNGLGALLVAAVQQKDFAVVQAIALILVLAFLVINLVVDLLYAVIDPRLRFGRRTA
jgi:peptide/nickel transport system permease protein